MLSSDFKSILADIRSTGTFRISNLRPDDLRQMSPILAGHLFDPNRSNSSIVPFSKFSFFKDLYHRDGNLSDISLSLSWKACVVKIPDSSNVLIAVVSHLLPAVLCYLRDADLEEPATQTIKKVIAFNKVYPHLKTNENVCYITIPSDFAKRTLHELGIMGALPNRDWQLQQFCSRFINIQTMVNQYFDDLSHFDEPDFLRHVAEIPDLIDVSRSFTNIQNDIQLYISSQIAVLNQSIKSDQKYFYLIFLGKLISSIRNLDNDLQAKLSLIRLEGMLLKSTTISYSNFLRTIEACIDELLIMLILQNGKRVITAQQVSQTVKDFISKTVDAPPQMATLRTSAMQAITTAIQLGVETFQMKGESQPLRIFSDKSNYYEIGLTLSQIFKLGDPEVDEHLSVSISEDGSVIYTEFNSGTIYDFYIASFESNVLLGQTQTQFTDLNSFVENQLKLRNAIGQRSERPLLVLIDNTMSDFDDTYLPFFLLQFDENIKSGQLCVLIVHSGNKYMHLGTDKALAALFYGYYNPEFFPNIEELINQEMKENRLGDFDCNSPTVVLTNAYLEHGRQELIKFGPLIRSRALHLYNSVIPKGLLGKEQYYTVENPIADGSYSELPKACSLLQNSNGFFVVKCLGLSFFAGIFEEKVRDALDKLLADVGITARDGFGFDETTYTYITVSEHASALRISIGTESLDSITQSIKTICYFLIQINGLTDKYAREFNTNIDQTDLSHALNRVATLLMDSPQEIEAAYQSAILEYKRLKSVTSTSISFFNTKIVEKDSSALSVQYTPRD